MSYDSWKTTNPDEEWYGPEPPPCGLEVRCRVNDRCVYCDAPQGQCWWGGEMKMEGNDD
jgi:hypothetical protein